MALVLLFGAGCATPYRPARGGKGYEETRLAPDQFRVSFQGNGQTSSQQANDFALLRAAQLTLEHGFHYFAVIDVTNTTSARPYIQRQQFYSDYPPYMGLPPPALGASDPYRFGYIVEYEEPRIYFRPGIRLLIRCFARKPDKPFTYDAAALQQSFKQKYRIH
jgi:hypothetical protein